MAERKHPRGVTPEERQLEPWFAAVRGEPAEPPLALLSAILADAAAVDDARNAAPPGTAGTPAVVAAVKPVAMESVALETVAVEPALVAAPSIPSALPSAPAEEDGHRTRAWKAFAALAACAALGFWIGLAGQVTIEDGAVWSGVRSAAAEDAPDDPVGAFFDLASLEG